MANAELTNEVKDEKVESIVADENNDAEVMKQLNDIQQKYSQLAAQSKQCDSVIAELNDRVLRQREAKNIIVANMLQLESEYNKLSAQVK